MFPTEYNAQYYFFVRNWLKLHSKLMKFLLYQQHNILLISTSLKIYSKIEFYKNKYPYTTSTKRLLRTLKLILKIQKNFLNESLKRLQSN